MIVKKESESMLDLIPFILAFKPLDRKYNGLLSASIPKPWLTKTEYRFSL